MKCTVIIYRIKTEIYFYFSIPMLHDSNRIWTFAKLPENGAKQIEMCCHYRP